MGRTCTLPTEKPQVGIEPGTFLLWGKGANHHTTIVQPHHIILNRENKCWYPRFLRPKKGGPQTNRNHNSFYIQLKVTTSNFLTFTHSHLICCWYSTNIYLCSFQFSTINTSSLKDHVGLEKLSYDFCCYWLYCICAIKMPFFSGSCIKLNWLSWCPIYTGSGSSIELAQVQNPAWGPLLHVCPLSCLSTFE